MESNLVQNDILGGFVIVCSQNKQYNSRSIYSSLDFLGDIGGLFDMLCIFAKIFLNLVTIVFGSELDQFLLSNVFKQNQNHSYQTTETL